jgi:plastocyanin
MIRYSLAPLGLLVLAGTTAAAQPSDSGIDWSQAEVVEVVMTNFKFTPETVTLQQGQPYRLRLVNQSSRGHSFASPAFFETATVQSEDVAIVNRGAVEVRKQQTQELRLVPRTAGTYQLKCSHFLHAGSGMKGLIIIEQATGGLVGAKGAG